ncbi:hypothetical protein [Parabacteroides distasonis]|uniref:hypothetical protein n=1 Tax=Parabacteroides distasonis TaxID=823 RepID=UPI001D15B9BA|nr:hypothetical protein [Parabacteroides distasonis]UVR22327.1 hypothetical protein NXX93_01385 [Parabacteroides distasonis]
MRQCLAVIPPQFVSKETTGRSRQRTADKGEHRDHSAHGSVDAIVGLAKRSQHHATGEERHAHHHQHPQVEECRVLGNAPLC